MDRPWMKHVVEGTPAEIDVPNLSIVELLNESVQKYSEHTAMTFKDISYTYEQLDKSIKSMASALVKLGIEKGDRVGLMLPNCPQYPIGYYAGLSCGATIVQINPMYKATELLHVLNDANVKTIIVFEPMLPIIEGIRSETPIRNIISVNFSGTSRFDELIQDPGNIRPEVVIEPKEDIAVLQYTGGTTGRAKGAMLTHYNIVANILQCAATTRIQTDYGKERLLAVAPLVHVYGMTSAMCLTFYYGGNLILVPRFEVEEVVDIIEKLRPTCFPAVPTMYIALLKYYETRKFDLSCLTKCNSGSAPLPVEVIHRFNEMSGTKVAEGFGLTEASPVTHRNPVRGLQKVGSIGIPIPSTEAKIVDAATGKQELPIGEVGELIIKGPQIMKGYLNLPEETKEAIRGGWLYTGDLAKMDEDGFFYIVGRKKDLIIVSGYNVYPIEVENVLYTHPAILEAAVIGVPDEYQGESIKAIVVLKENRFVTEEELIQYCREQLAAYKVPRSVNFVESLPKTTVGKILKRKLKETV